MLLGTEVLEVLVAEHKKFTFSSVECEFVETRFAKLRDLHSFNLGTKVRADVVDFSVGAQEIWLLWVCPQSGVGVFCSFPIQKQFHCMNGTERTK